MTPNKPLADNLKNISIAYHGRASSNKISGTQVVQSNRQFLIDNQVFFVPSEELDYKLEIAFLLDVNLILLNQYQ